MSNKNNTPNTYAIIDVNGTDIGPSSAGKGRRKLERVTVKLADGSIGELYGTVYIAPVETIEKAVTVAKAVEPKVRKADAKSAAPSPKAAMIAALAKKLGLSDEEAAILAG